MTESRVEAARWRLQVRLQWGTTRCECGHQRNQHNYAALDCAMPSCECARFAWDGVADPDLAEFEQAVSEKARDEERRAVLTAIAEVEARHEDCGRGECDMGDDVVDTIRARLAASPTEEANRG